MAEIKINLRARVAWWVRWYLSTCIWFALLFGMRPDAGKIASFVARHGVTVEVDRG